MDSASYCRDRTNNGWKWQKGHFGLIFKKRHWKCSNRRPWSQGCRRMFSSSAWGLKKGIMTFSPSISINPPSLLPSLSSLSVFFLSFLPFLHGSEFIDYIRKLVFLMVSLSFSSWQLHVVNRRVLFSICFSQDLSWSPDELSFINATPLPLALFRGFCIRDLASLLFTFFLNPGRICGCLICIVLLVCWNKCDR